MVDVQKPASPGRYWDQRSRAFTPYRQAPDNYGAGYGENFDAFLRLLGPVEGKQVVELGCGNGEYSIFLARKGARVLALDASPGALENTRAIAALNRVSDRV